MPQHKEEIDNWAHKCNIDEIAVADILYKNQLW